MPPEAIDSIGWSRRTGLEWQAVDKSATFIMGGSLTPSPLRSGGLALRLPQ